MRWALVEAAWVIRRRLRVAGLKAMRRGAREELVEMAAEADRYLHAKYWRVLMRQKAPAVAAVATARCLAEVLWKIAQRLPWLEEA